jgi:hypothetical protein
MPFPVDIKYVKQAEEKLGVRLPLSYVASICKENGGVVMAGEDSWSLHPIFDQSDRKRISRTCNDIGRETTSARRGWAGFPADAVAIAANGGGDCLVFVPDPGQAGRLSDAVFLWDHETGELDKVADDFLELERSG